MFSFFELQCSENTASLSNSWSKARPTAPLGNLREHSFNRVLDSLSLKKQTRVAKHNLPASLLNDSHLNPSLVVIECWSKYNCSMFPSTAIELQGRRSGLGGGRGWQRALRLRRPRHLPRELGGGEGPDHRPDWRSQRWETMIKKVLNSRFVFIAVVR